MVPLQIHLSSIKPFDMCCGTVVRDIHSEIKHIPVFICTEEVDEATFAVRFSIQEYTNNTLYRFDIEGDVSVSDSIIVSGPFPKRTRAYAYRRRDRSLTLIKYNVDDGLGNVIRASDAWCLTVFSRDKHSPRTATTTCNKHKVDHKTGQETEKGGGEDKKQHYQKIACAERKPMDEHSPTTTNIHKTYHKGKEKENGGGEDKFNNKKQPCRKTVCPECNPWIKRNTYIIDFAFV
jgi:hypothetical protein